MNTKKLSNKQEKRIAKEMSNAKVTIASGALDFQKADVRNDMFLVEAKTTGKDFYPLNIKTWSRINQQALNDGLRIPVMSIDLEDGKYSIAILKELDAWGLFDEVMLKNKITYVGNPVPNEANKSFRIKSNFLNEEFYQDVTQFNSYIRRMDVVLGEYKLVCMDWNDFIYLQNITEDKNNG